jgi:predicted nucleotide-binding protein
VTAPIVDQELVVHVFFPSEAPPTEAVYQQIKRLWAGCRSQLGMTDPIVGIAATATLPDDRTALPADEVIAAQERIDANRQAVLRRVYDVLNLSVVLAQPIPQERLRRPLASGPAQLRGAESSPPRQLGWAEMAQLWSQASAPGCDAAVGETRLFLARAPAGAIGTVAATQTLGQALEPLLPYREDRARGWWRWGTTTRSGYAVWDLSPGGTDTVREIVIVAAADRDDEVSAWAWSDGTTDLPPFARYLLHAAKLRYEARLLDAWEQGPRHGDIDGLLAELSAALTPDAAYPGRVGLLRSRLSRLRAEETRLMSLEASLAKMSTTVGIAGGNLRAAADRDGGEGAVGLYAADQELALWLSQQVEDDLAYLRADLVRTRRVGELAGQELSQAEREDPPAVGAAAPSAGTVHPAADDIRRKVFVVYGRDTGLVDRFYDLLRAVDLRPLEWETLVRAGGSATPQITEVVAAAPHLAQATLVLLTPDDIVELHSDFHRPDDLAHERGRMGQARPNVLFEMGLALMAYPKQTVIVEVGYLRPVSDLSGLVVTRFDGSVQSIRRVIGRLEVAGCVVDTSALDWLNPDRFADLRTYLRGPDTHRPPRSADDVG